MQEDNHDKLCREVDKGFQMFESDSDSSVEKVKESWENQIKEITF